MQFEVSEVVLKSLAYTSLESHHFYFIFFCPLLTRMLLFRRRSDRLWPDLAWPMRCVRLLPVHSG